MSARNVKLNIILAVALVLGLLFAAAPGSVMAASIVYVDNLQPSWTAPGGGGVYSAYIAPPDDGYVSPGTTSNFNDREAGIIKAGLTPKLDGHYDDEGLFGFIPNISIDTFAAGPVSYDVINETGSNPVWMTIEIDTNVVGDRNDNTTYQHVPTTNPVEWHTVNASAGLWQKWNNDAGDVTGNPLISLADVASEHTGLNVVRAYLRLGQGDSYHGTGAGTIGWVDKVTIGEVTYDFVVPQYWYVSPTGSDSNEGTLVSPFLTIQKAINSASAGNTINVATGTYNENLNITKPLTLVGSGVSTVIQVSTTSPVYGIYVKANDVTLKNFKVIGSNNIATGFYAFKIEGSNNLLMENVEVIQSGRTGVDLNGMTNSTLKTITVTNTAKGNGISLTDSNHIILDTITTSGNTWGGVAVYTKGTAGYPCAESLVTLTGTNSIAETNPLYASVDTVGCATPVITQSDFPYVLTTSAAPTAFQWYNTTPQQLFALAQAIEDKPTVGFLASVVIKSLATNDYYVFPGMSIQTAINTATAGATIHVAAGTYAQNLIVNKDVTINGPNTPDGTDDAVINGKVEITAAGATVQSLKIVPGSVIGAVAGVIVTASDVTITGNLIDGMVGDGTGSIKGIHVFSSPTVITNIAITNNTVRNITTTLKGADGIMVQGSVSGVTVTGNTVDTVSGGWAYGIEVTPSGAAPTVSPLAVLIQDNLIKNVVGAGVSIDVAGNPEVAANALQVTVIENAFANVPYPINNKDAAHTLNASPNWFGTITGPVTGTILGLVDSDPWCGNAACTFMVTSNPSGQVLLPIGIVPADIQAALDSVPEGTKLVLPTGLINRSGGFNVSVPHTTIILSQGTNIANQSPCFTISADYTTITAASKLAATCTPSAGNDGIELTKAVKNLVVENIEFIGTAGTNGMHFDYVVTDLLIKDNYIHGFPANGLLFGAQPEGVIDIHGNLFVNNTGKGIESGALVVPAEYNSWGNVAGAASGDGISSGVDADPWTHVDLYMTSSGSPVVNTVAKDNTITYTVYGNFANAMAVDFALVYPANLTLVDGSLDEATTFDTLPTFDTTVPNRIVFKASSLAAVNGTQPLFSVTFTGVAPVVGAALNLDNTTDNFGMGGAGSSTNIYAFDLVDGMVTVIDRFSITGTVSMQGRTTRAGVQLLLANGILMNYGPFQTTSVNVLSGNFSITNLVADTYQFTTNQPRYLNVTTANNKNIILGADVTLNPLELKGGDADGNNEIRIGDATLIGSNYLKPDYLANADVNFDNIVNIFDLAMVGGNFTMTGAIYDSWVPVP